MVSKRQTKKQQRANPVILKSNSFQINMIQINKIDCIHSVLIRKSICSLKYCRNLNTKQPFLPKTEKNQCCSLPPCDCLCLCISSPRTMSDVELVPHRQAPHFASDTGGDALPPQVPHPAGRTPAGGTHCWLKGSRSRTLPCHMVAVMPSPAAL